MAFVSLFLLINRYTELGERKLASWVESIGIVAVKDAKNAEVATRGMAVIWPPGEETKPTSRPAAGCS